MCIFHGGGPSLLPLLFPANYKEVLASINTSQAESLLSSLYRFNSNRMASEAAGEVEGAIPKDESACVLAKQKFRRTLEESDIGVADYLARAPLKEIVSFLNLETGSITTLKDKTWELNIIRFPNPVRKTVHLPISTIHKNWVYPGDDGVFHGISTTNIWIKRLMLEHSVLGPAFAPVDISVFATGELRPVSIYWNLGLALLDTEKRQDPNAKITMDCTGNLVQDVWLSEALEMAMRTRTDGRAKIP